MRVLAVFIGFMALSGCAVNEPKKYMTSEYSDDQTCRSFMKNKARNDDTTYEGCRRSLIELANNPPAFYPGPTPSNITIIVNQ